MWKIYVVNNYFFVEKVGGNNAGKKISFDKSLVRISKDHTTDIYNIFFDRKSAVHIDNDTPITFANILDENGVAYTTVAVFEAWYTSNTGMSAGGQLTPTVLRNRLETVQFQDDYAPLIDWLDIGTADERPDKIRHTSATLGAAGTVTETFTWGGSAGGYYPTSAGTLS